MFMRSPPQERFLVLMSASYAGQCAPAIIHDGVAKGSYLIYHTNAIDWYDKRS
jgi:hypothetical protein